jgi:inner membrane protein
MESLIDWIASLGHWGWWTLALLLVIVEVFAPSTFFLWLGIAAAIVGGAIYFVPDMDWETQWSIFAVISIVSVVASRFLLQKKLQETDNPTLNKRGSQYIGRNFTLSEAIINGRGKIHVDDSQWVVEGTDANAGSTVRVTGVDGTYLKVEAVEKE